MMLVVGAGNFLVQESVGEKKKSGVTRAVWAFFVVALFSCSNISKKIGPRENIASFFCFLDRKKKPFYRKQHPNL